LDSKPRARRRRAWAQQQQDYTASQNYLLQGQATAENALLQAKTTATTYRYQGAEEEAQFGLESGQLTEEAAANMAAAKAGKLQASLVDVNARQSMVNSLSNIAVMRAAGGVNPTSPTTAAVEGYDYNVGEINRISQEATINTQTAQEQAAAAYETASANFALQDWFRLMATATVTALREGRTSVVSSNRAAIICSCRRLGMRLGARIELVERGDLVDVIFSPAQ
jgi:hypothetical protein